MRIILVADGSKLPVVAAPPPVVIELVGHVEPVVRPARVGVLRDEGLEWVWDVALNVDVVADVRLECRTNKRVELLLVNLTGENSKCSARKP